MIKRFNEYINEAKTEKKNVFRLVPWVERTKDLIESDGKNQERCEGTLDEAIESAKKMLDKNDKFYKIEISTVTDNPLKSKKKAIVTKDKVEKL